MIITNEKIEVTLKMLDENNMTRFGQIGIPAEIGLRWKDWAKLTESDLDAIEDYFINKTLKKS